MQLQYVFHYLALRSEPPSLVSLAEPEKSSQSREKKVLLRRGEEILVGSHTNKQHVDQPDFGLVF